MCGVEYEESENPVAKVDKMESEELRNRAAERSESVMYNVMIEIGSCIVTPEENTKYGVKIKIGEHEYSTDDKVVVGANYNRWNHRPSKILNWAMPYKSLDNMADVFVYLTKTATGISGVFSGGGKSSESLLSYARFKASEFGKTSPKIRWVELKPEPVTDKIDSPEKAGILSFKISIID